MLEKFPYYREILYYLKDIMVINGSYIAYFIFRYPKIATYSTLAPFVGKIKRGKEITPAFHKLVKVCRSTKKTDTLLTKPFPIGIQNDDVKDSFDMLREKHKEDFKKGMDLFIVNIGKVKN